MSELTSVSRALRTLSAGNRTLIRAATRQELLDSMCAAIVEAGDYPMASVWYKIDDPQRSLRPKAQCGYPGGLAALRKMTVSWADNAYGQGALARAVRGGLPTVAHDMKGAPAYQALRPYLDNYACSAAFPLQVEGEVVGGLVICAIEAHAFGPNELALLAELADDLAFGLATLRARAEQENVRRAMHRLTRHDALTGLPNETQFTETLAEVIEAAQREARPFAVLQTNVERLNEINIALGFNQGDKILRELAERLRAAAPLGATVARLRGDEFGILLPGSDGAATIAATLRLEQALAIPFPVADISLDVQIKMGIALYPAHGCTVHDLLRHVDMAVHRAMQHGVGHMVFDPAQNRDQAQRLNMAGELRRAIEGGELRLYLQPKVDMRDGRVCGAEGLVRWQHPRNGVVPPGEFIGLAEHTGLIKPLTEWVIETALRLLQQWEKNDVALPIAVNLSARNLRDERLLGTVRRLQATWQVRPGLLEMELTESMVMEDAELALRVLGSLRAQGIPLYIDDFGTGYSSLSYLQKLPVQYIKIDQSFVRDMGCNRDSTLIVRSTIDLAHDLGCKVVAEGVETQQHWDLLAALGCDIAQGYLIARPMPPEEFEAWLRGYEAPAASRA